MKLRPLTKVNEPQQKALRELAKIYRQLQVSKARLARIHGLQQLSLETEMSLHNALEHLCGEIHKASCQLLGITWTEQKSQGINDDTTGPECK